MPSKELILSLESAQFKDIPDPRRASGSYQRAAIETGIYVFKKSAVDIRGRAREMGVDKLRYAQVVKYYSVTSSLPSIK